MQGTEQERFWAKVEKTDTCWLWTAALNYAGYPVFGNPQWRAHRLAYTWLVGPIPEGLTLDHLCRVRHCVNPAHLEPVTVGVNTLRGDTISARNAAKTHCPEGHPLISGNLWPSGVKRGWRNCLACTRKADAKRKREARAVRRVAVSS